MNGHHGLILTDMENEIEEERKNIIQVILAFQYYLKYSNARVHKTEAYLNTFSNNHQEMLEKYRSHLNKVRDCLSTNNSVLKELLRNVRDIFPDNDVIQESVRLADNGQAGQKVRVQDLESPQIEVEPFKLLKVQTTLKQIARDWSSEGEEERQQCYKPIIDEILNHFDPNKRCWKILVPGSGLGRLIYELALLGFYCEGNEVSLFMLLASNFVLNFCDRQNKYTIFPWVHQYCNNLYRCDQIAPVQFPDVCPSSSKFGKFGEMRVIAGDFLQVYTEQNWDCVATCFFIDCANNIIEFIETVYRILQPGGFWINLGPLLYHYSDIDNENSIEPTFEDIELIIKSVGFEIIQKRTGIRTKYAQNYRSILKTEYESVFWVCRKPLDANPNGELQLSVKY